MYETAELAINTDGEANLPVLQEDNLRSEEIDLSSLLFEKSWRQHHDLPINLCVSIPLQEITLSQLAKMTPGILLRSIWPLTEDVPLSANGTFLANVCFEPAGSNLGVRISDFTPRASALPQLLNGYDETEELANSERLSTLTLKCSLLFGMSQTTLHNFMNVSAGRVLLLDRAVNAPVKVTVRGSVIASGHLVGASNFYAVEIVEIARMARFLQAR